MATGFKWFRSTATGKVGLYPARFASRPTFEEVEPDEADSLSIFSPVETVDENELPYDLYEDEYSDDSETEEK